MKNRGGVNIVLVALSLILTSCGCSSEKGSEFFSKTDPVNSSEISLSGGVSGGGAEDPIGIAGGAGTSAGVSSGGVASTGGAGSGAPPVVVPPAVDVPPPVVVKPPPAIVPPPSEKDICDPLKEEGEEIALGYGLVGKLYDGAPNKIQNFSELLKKGKALEGAIYMSNLNIPTRKFDKGFPRENGLMVMNAMGQNLIENFGIEFTGSLELMKDDEPGYYEIGLIADDGVVLEMNKGPLPEEMKGIIEGDHLTSSKLFCSNFLVRMEKNKPMPLRLRYFQGPRYHIALIMTWRRVESLEASNDTLMKSALKNPIKETRCGIAGNSFFFDPDSNSHPQMEFLDMLDPAKRVVPWKVVKHKNLRLPAGYSNKQCVTKKL